MSYSETTVLFDSATQIIANEYEPIESTSESITRIVHKAVGRLPMQEEVRERLLFCTVVDHLANGNAFAAAYELIAETTGFAGTYALLPTYCAIISSLDALDAAGHSIPGSDHLLRFIRNQARNEIVRLPVNGEVQWIVPFGSADRTAAHVAALIFTRRGSLSRPWLWDAIPEHGKFLVIGREARLHPKKLHHRCNGCLTFFDAALGACRE